MVSKGSDYSSNFSEEKKELLALLLEEEGILLSQAAAIQPGMWQGNPPLSFAQERLWFLYQMEPDSALYNIPMALRCAGPLDVAALEKSLTEILQRHQTLRSIYGSRNGQPVQQITPPQPLTLPLTDLRSLPFAQRQEKLETLITGEACQPFNLETGPLLRGRLLRLQEDEHVLLITVHHIVADGLSYTIFMQELKTLYEAFSIGQPSPLKELPFQFADFAHWQRQWLENKGLEEQLDYWQKQLAGASGILELPTDWPRPPRQSYPGAHSTKTIDAALTGDLKTTSRRQGVSLFVMLLAAFKVLLYRYTNQDDIIVGSPVANRNQSEVDKLIGLFINTIPLRTKLAGNPTFEALVGQVNEAVLESQDHQELPFEKLVEALQIKRHMNRTPLFQVIFNYQSSLVISMTMGELAVQLLEQPGGLAKFDLTLDIREINEQLAFRMEYNTDLFASDTIERLLGHYETLLRAVVDNPEQRIDNLPLLTSAETSQILDKWRGTTSDYPRQACVHTLFERQAAATPTATALLSEAGTITYQALNEQANQIAHYLQKRGVGPEIFVAVCLERSPLTVAVLLGILKAGGVYVPLEPDYPGERLTYMLQDTQSLLLLTNSHLLARLPDERPHTILLDSEAALIEQQSTADPSHTVSADNLAYVMYTSGSTGQPKGVNINHRNIVRLVKETNFASLTAEETFLQFAPISFDASTLELWGPLLNGGRLAIMPPQKAGLAELAHALQQYQVTTLWLTAGLFHQMVEDHPEALAQVRQLLAGGDVLSAPHIKKLLQVGKGQTVINGYGPTENTTFTCCHPMETAEQLGSSVPIGQPIANTQLYLLDKNLKPTPVGIPGHLYTGGDGLARGYLNHPRATAEKFIPHPFSRDAGARLYKTGDLARWRPDGSVEFLGRQDNQVKIRGFRVELGEVEVALSQHPDVENVVVVAHDDAVGSKQLAAYFVPAQTPPPTLGTLRRFVRQRLPDYMVPASFIALDKLPLSANGKVDRRALPSLERGRPAAAQTFVAPRNEIEEKLTEIWLEMLRQEQIGIHDNFFELGGHSLLATRIMSRIEAAFSVSLPLYIIFESPTIQGMAENINHHLNSQSDGQVDAIQPAASDDEEQLLTRLQDMPEEEVDSLLDLMLSEFE